MKRLARTRAWTAGVLLAIAQAAFGTNIDRAREAALDGRADEAILLLQPLANTNAGAAAELAVIHASMGRLATAAAVVANALRNNPDDIRLKTLAKRLEILRRARGPIPPSAEALDAQMHEEGTQATATWTREIARERHEDATPSTQGHPSAKAQSPSLDARTTADAPNTRTQPPSPEAPKTSDAPSTVTQSPSPETPKKQDAPGARTQSPSPEAPRDTPEARTQADPKQEPTPPEVPRPRTDDAAEKPRTKTDDAAEKPHARSTEEPLSKTTTAPIPNDGGTIRKRELATNEPYSATCTLERKRERTIAPGEDLDTAIERWGGRDGWRLLVRTEHIWTSEIGYRHEGTLHRALDTMLAAFSQAQPRPRIEAAGESCTLRLSERWGP